MKILVVGAAGNIGQAVTRLLKAEGHQVIQVGRTRGDRRCCLNE
ncbi:NAD-dependent epimerase/dehydratase family protein [Shewanella xiamenensis]|nr:NAD-dependent epimerase/dehydratase family protein [Shewanella xiamenensis]